MCVCVLFFQVDEQSSCFSLDVGVVVGRRSIQVAHQSKLQVNPGASQSRTSPGCKSIRLQVSHGCKSIVLVRRSNVESGSLPIPMWERREGACITQQKPPVPSAAAFLFRSGTGALGVCVVFTTHIAPPSGVVLLAMEAATSHAVQRIVKGRPRAIPCALVRRAVHM